MLLVVPVRSLLFYCATSMSVYSFVGFLMTASPMEIQFMGTLFSAISALLMLIAGIYVIPRLFARLSDIEEICRSCGTCGIDDATSESSEESHDSHESNTTIYYEESRIVEEKDGRLIVTTTFKPIDAAEELREMVEAPAEASPVEETTEFADLLMKGVKKDQ